ncbi:hypothetical protein G9A89_002955, partial [Geosiphon pyriformis]
ILRKSKRLDNILEAHDQMIPPGILDFRNDQTGDWCPKWASAADPFVLQYPKPAQRGSFQIMCARRGCTIKLTMEQFSDWIESLLAFHSFLKYGGSLFAESSNIALYVQSFHNLMSIMQLGFSRGEASHEFKLQKFLECSHFGMDHVIHGPPVAHNSDTGERGLKDWAKAPAATAQNRSDKVFKGQAARNTVESQTLARLVAAGSATSLTTTVSSNGPDQINPGTQLRVGGRSLQYVQRPDGLVGVVPSNPSTETRGTKSHNSFPPEVLDWFKATFKGRRGPALRIQLFTEVTLAVGTNQEELIRAHPDYRSEGPWYDFVSIDYGDDGDFPARCACFFEWPEQMDSSSLNLGAFGPHQPGDVMVVVQQSDWQQRESTVLPLHTSKHRR